MTEQEKYIIFGYLCNPNRLINLEVEIPEKSENRFIQDYSNLTRNHPLPLNTSTAPYYVWRDNPNKWGIEPRGYFTANLNLPIELEKLLEPNRFQNRPGYEIWERRFSIKAFVYELFGCGFVLGNVQDEARIRSFVPPNFINDFNNGYGL